MGIPRQLLRQLYTFGSLQNAPAGITFELKNRLLPVELVAVRSIVLNGRPVPPERVKLHPEGGELLAPADITAQQPLSFGLRQRMDVFFDDVHLAEGHHELALRFEVAGFGELHLEIEDALHHGEAEEEASNQVPHCDRDDYSSDLVAKRQRFVEEVSGVTLDHVTRFSFDAARTRGNIENFTGVAQVPLGFAGPIEVHGEHAEGRFLIPMATTEGTLVASYNRGIKVLNLAGGARVVVTDDAMQRAPVFVFSKAAEARDFRAWVEQHFAGIQACAEATSKHCTLHNIDTYLSNKFAYLRFSFRTGDAAGQNMVGRATFAACQWILERVDTVRNFYLEANLATDKKHSQVNVMRTRGKRVTAEATVPRELLIEHMRVTPEALDYHARLGTIGALLSGASNNGAHSPNGITAMFIATGQDVANVAESSAGILYTELTEDRDLYLSLTIPSLIVATHGGGTKLPTQRECLEVLGCTGSGSVGKFAEIVGAVALAGELSLGAAISSLDWVSSHERLGRNRE